MNLYCAISLPPREKAFLREQLGDLPHAFADELPEAARRPAFLRADICFGNPPPAWLEEAGRLRWLQLESAGFGEYQNARKKDDLVITNLKGFFAVPVAESALAGILALYRGIDTLNALQREKKWVGLALRPYLKTLYGAKVLILGGGSIGGHFARLLQPFEAEITVFGRQSAPADLDRVIPAMDIIIGCLPETNETINLMNKTRLEAMAPHAVFVNVGRGSVVDEPALIALLRERKIGGGVLDVTAREPLPPDSPLWDCPNTILTQHTGGGFGDEAMGKVRFFLGNLERYRQGQPLTNIVTLERGY